MNSKRVIFVDIGRCDVTEGVDNNDDAECDDGDPVSHPLLMIRLHATLSPRFIH